MGKIEKTKGKTEIKQDFINLRAKGHTIRHIAKSLHLSPQTVLNWESDLNEEISRLKAVELESLYEQYQLTKKYRIKEISGQIQAIQKELSNRNLSDISTDRLMDLNLRYLERADREYIEPKFFLNDNRTITKLDSQDISLELYLLLLRFRSGVIDSTEASRENTILQGMLKAEEQGDIQEKVEELKRLLEGNK
jgi:hypothetical protein